jgi:acyl-CoA thioesterase-1
MILSLAMTLVALAAGAAEAAQSAPPAPVVEAAPSPAPPSESVECTQAKAQIVRLEERLLDWPLLARYRDENAKLPAPAGKEKRVVFMGDSITDFWDDPARSPGFFPGEPYVNRGISGQTTAQMLIRFRPDVLRLRPAVVVILAGTNDISNHGGPETVQAVEDNLTSMAELARAHDVRVVLASLLPVSDYGKRADGTPRPQTARRPPPVIRAINAWMKEYAAANSLVYLDYHSAMADGSGQLKAELSNDGLHPNEKGYEVMAPLARRAIVAALR